MHPCLHVEIVISAFSLWNFLSEVVLLSALQKASFFRHHEHDLFLLIWVFLRLIVMESLDDWPCFSNCLLSENWLFDSLYFASVIREAQLAVGAGLGHHDRFLDSGRPSFGSEPETFAAVFVIIQDGLWLVVLRIYLSVSFFFSGWQLCPDSRLIVSCGFPGIFGLVAGEVLRSEFCVGLGPRLERIIVGEHV